MKSLIHFLVSMTAPLAVVDVLVLTRASSASMATQIVRVALVEVADSVTVRQSI